jgi:NAD-dependent deacetylase
MLVVGSSLTVYPAALVPEEAVRSGAKLFIINIGRTGLDHLADIVANFNATVVLPKIVEKVESIIHGSG